MLTKGKIQTIKSYADKKHRNARGVFVVEGAKSVAELLKTDLIIEELYVTHNFSHTYEKEIHETCKRQAQKQLWLKPQLIEAGELRHMGSLEMNDGALAIVKQPKIEQVDLIPVAQKDIVLVLEDIRDPGNLGTIIRIADWYGIKHILASVGTVDVYNNKTILASMGSYARVQIQYTDIKVFLKGCSSKNILTIGSTLEGKNSHAYAWPKNGVLVIGNESNGLSEDVLSLVKNKITIPSYGSAESLNAGVATAVLLDEWRRSNK